MFPLHRDVISGCILFASGVTFTLYVLSEYSVGTLQRFGPGMFPMALGCILSVLGLLIVLAAHINPETYEWPTVAPRAVLATLLSIATFSLTLRTVGMIPAVVLTTLVATAAERKLSFARALVFSVLFSLLTAAIFGYLLGMPIPLARNPF